MNAAAKSEPRAIPHLELRSDWGFLVTVVLIALLLRLDFLFANNFVIDADEAIVGLMAKHISEFKTLPTFYYGQHYMGSLEPILTALVFLVFGISSVALKSVPLFFSLLLIILVYQLGLELGNRGLARIAALLAALPPQLLVIWSGMARGGFVEIVCIGCAASIAMLRWLRSYEPSPRHTALIGALLGVGWWVNNQVVFFALPIAFFMASYFLSAEVSLSRRIHALLKHGGIGALAFFLGGFPYWIYNVQHEFVSFEIAKGATFGQMQDHVAGLAGTALPMLLGARRQWHSEEVFPKASLIAAILYAALLLIVVVKRRREIGALVRLRIDRRQPVEFFLLLLLVTFTIFAVSSYGALVESPRYLLPSYVAIFILSAGGLSFLYAFSRGLAYVVLSALLLINCASWYLGGRALPGEPFVYHGERVSKDQSELLSWLEKKGFDLIRTNYWIGYRIAFESRERVRFTVYQPPVTVRILGYEEEARRRGRSFLPLVLVPSQAELVRRAFEVEGFRFKEERLSGYVVFYDIAPVESELSRVPLNTVRAEATDADANAHLAIDGNHATRWGSARPQAPGMRFSVELREPRLLRGLRYELSRWPQDDPQSLGIELQLADGSRKVLLKPEDYPSVRFFRERESAMLFAFKGLPVKKVVLSQHGTQQIFDWSIAELELLE